MTAQNADGTYDAPQPCGPGLPDTNRPANPDEKITSGRLALFDAYWHVTSESLNNNLCPPSITQTTENGRDGVIVTTTRAATNIDVTWTDINLTDDYKVTVIDSGAPGYVAGAVASPTIDKAEYKFLEDVEPGDEVWWLRLDDPDTTDDDETSDLQLGFSTLLFDGDYWHRTGSDKPLQYHYEAERHSLEPADEAHFYAFEAPQAGNAEQAAAIWDSTLAETTPMEMRPGEYREVQWVITKPGTHRLGVHIQGYVRQDAPEGWDADANGAWQPLTHQSHNKVVTSEVVYYTFQVGSLTLNREAMFTIEGSVPENSAPGTLVVAPIVVTNPDGDALAYSLSGSGHEHFVAVSSNDGRGVQVDVANGASLDYETTQSYDLVLGLSDGKDRESNPDPTIDHTIAVKIDLEDEPPSATLSVDNANPTVGEKIRLLVTTREFPANGYFIYEWQLAHPGGAFGDLDASTWNYHDITNEQPNTSIYRVKVTWVPSGASESSPPAYTPEVRVTWSE